MTTITPAAGSGDYCLPIKVPLDRDLWDVDKTWVVIAAIVGFIIGALVAIFCAFLCLRAKYAKESGEQVGYFVCSFQTFNSNNNGSFNH